jgi:hypothetical protein
MLSLKHEDGKLAEASLNCFLSFSVNNINAADAIKRRFVRPSIGAWKRKEENDK